MGAIIMTIQKTNFIFIILLFSNVFSADDSKTKVERSSSPSEKENYEIIEPDFFISRIFELIDANNYQELNKLLTTPLVNTKRREPLNKVYKNINSNARKKLVFLKFFIKPSCFVLNTRNGYSGFMGNYAVSAGTEAGLEPSGVRVACLSFSVFVGIVNYHYGGVFAFNRQVR